MGKEKASLYKAPASFRNAIFGKLNKGTLVQVTREWVNNRWNEIKVVDPSLPGFQKSGIKNKFFFVKHKDLAPLPFLKDKILEKVYVKPVLMSKLERVTIPDWAKNTGIPYYHRADTEYWISVKLPHTTCIGGKMDELVQQAKMLAVKDLFKYYNIKYDIATEQEINKFIDGFLSCYVHDYHLDDRPGSKLKMLVKVRANYFNWLIENGEPLRSNKLEDLPEAVRVITLDPDKYEEEVDKMAKMMAKFALDMQRDDVFVPGVNLMKESRQLKQFVSRLKSFIVDNGYDTNNRYGRKYYIEVGMGEGFDILYVVLKFDKKSRNLGA